MRAQVVRGFSMIEILVAILVLAIGVLGAAGMQLVAMRTSTHSDLHTQAYQLATEIADRIRANDAVMRSPSASNPFLSVDYSAGGATPTAPATTCFTTSCNPDQLAAFDLFEFQTRVFSSFPGGRLVICQDGAPWDASEVTLQWDCAAPAAGDPSVVIKIGWTQREVDGSLSPAAQGAPAVALVVSPYVP